MNDADAEAGNMAMEVKPRPAHAGITELCKNRSVKGAMLRGNPHPGVGTRPPAPFGLPRRVTEQSLECQEAKKEKP